ncbi:proline-rich protein HaeIII subfamily 1-like [Mirounga leonina]|uniref:proline-rich protein HaeIII subfamily 1-like n=1 Tax=Mirounga leonina TaxID=9715 RepID=UPI00156BE6A3|nr:proline-rich protein HaeIII subfamily 1-like [Mirounga leonina]
MRWDPMGPGDSSRDLLETGDQLGSDSAQGPKEETTAEGQTPGSPPCDIQSTPASKPVDPAAPFLQRGDSDEPLGHSRRSTPARALRARTLPPGGLSATAPAGRGHVPQVARGPRIPLLRKEGAPGDTPPPAQHGDGDGARSPRSKRAPSSALRPAVSGRVPESEVRRAPPRGAAPAAPPDPDPDPDSGSAPPAPRRVPGPRAGSLPRAPRALPAPGAHSRAPARNKAGGGAAPYLGERRVRRGDGRSRPGAEQRSSARAGRPPGSPPRPPQGPLEAARAIATAAPGRRSPGLSAQPCARRAGPPRRAPPCAPGTSPPARRDRQMVTHPAAPAPRVPAPQVGGGGRLQS